MIMILRMQLYIMVDAHGIIRHSSTLKDAHWNQ